MPYNYGTQDWTHEEDPEDIWSYGLVGKGGAGGSMTVPGTSTQPTGTQYNYGTQAGANWSLDKYSPYQTTGTKAKSLDITQTGQTFKRRQIGQISTPIVPSVAKPTMGTVAPLVALTVDEDRISSIARDVADPYLRKIGRTTKQELGKHYENRMIGAVNRRNIMAGLGDSLASILTASRQQGRTEEATERQIKYDVARTNYQAAVQRANTIYQSAWDDYTRQFGQKAVGVFAGDEGEYIYPETSIGARATTQSNVRTGLAPTQTRRFSPMI